MSLDVSFGAPCRTRMYSTAKHRVARPKCRRVHFEVSCGSGRHDGVQARRGKRCDRIIAEFGEKVLYRRGKPSALEGRWNTGVYLGIFWRSGAARIGLPTGVIAAHGLRLVPAEERWNIELIKAARGVPLGSCSN